MVSVAKPCSRLLNDKKLLMQTKKIVFLGSDCQSSRWVYNALKSDFSFSIAIIEQPISKITLFKRRVKKIGFLSVFSQSLFSLLIVPFLTWRGNKRKAELIKQYGLVNDDFEGIIIKVFSANDEACKKALEKLQPDIVLVNGTRILSKKILECTKAIFINMHVGITPQYRGSHGGYWALYNNDVQNFGTTIHLVDTGVDTGGVLKQVFIKPAKEDNFTTYPILQVAIGIPALKEVLLQVIKDDYSIKKYSEKGKMYYQPSIWGYFFGKGYNYN